jgi:serine/threonine protein phosphatase PrpC
MQGWIYTDIGHKRSINEDSILFVDKDNCIIINQSNSHLQSISSNGNFLALVSDGMGGHGSGEIASLKVCESFAHWFTANNNY